MSSLQPAVPEMLRIVQAMKDEIEVQDRFYRFKMYPMCFVGTQAVEWLVAHHHVTNDEQAVGLATLMLGMGLIRHVCGEHAFENKFLFYEFTLDATIDRYASLKGLKTSNQALDQENAQLRAHLYVVRRRQSRERALCSSWGLLLVVIVFCESAPASLLCALAAALASGYWLLGDHHDHHDDPHGKKTRRMSPPPVAGGITAAPVSLAAVAGVFGQSGISGVQEKRARQRRASINTSGSFHQTLPEFLKANDIVFELKEDIVSACVVSDTSAPCQPVVFVNDAFEEFSGYKREEVIGINCRFMQGPGTNKNDVQAVRDLVHTNAEGFVRILNYTKTGVSFISILYLVPLRDKTGVVKFYLGCQTRVGQEEGPAAMLGALPGLPSPTPTALLGTPKKDPSSRVKILTHTEPYLAQHPNRAAVPFETEWFKGHFHMRTQTPVDCDVYFADKRRTFEVQVQGKFLKPLDPEATLWFGGEVPRQMKLGRVKRAVAGLLLKFVNSFGRGLHASFGDTGVAGDRPHMVCPLLQALDRCVVTPAGETPPELGKLIPDTPEQKAWRKRTASKGSTYEVGPTYTLAFFSMYVDFEDWQACNFPGFSKSDLHSFWDDMGLQLVMYSLPPGADHLASSRQMMMHCEIVHESHPHYPEGSTWSPQDGSDRTSS